MTIENKKALVSKLVTKLSEEAHLDETILFLQNLLGEHDTDSYSLSTNLEAISLRYDETLKKLAQ